LSDELKTNVILSTGPPPWLGEEVVSPPSDGEAALLRAVVTPPESIYSKSSGKPSERRKPMVRHISSLGTFF
jgi:hypothetical protein